MPASFPTQTGARLPVTDVAAKTNGSSFFSCPRADATEKRITKTTQIPLTCIGGTQRNRCAFFICLLNTESVRLHHPRLQCCHVDHGPSVLTFVASKLCR